MFGNLLAKRKPEFAHYAAIPLDVPLAPIEAGKARKFVQKYCEQCAFSKDLIRYVAFFARKPVFDGQIDLHSITQSGSSRIPNGYEWDPAFKQRFPEFVEWIRILPFSRIDAMVLVTQTDDIRDHMDIFGKNNSVTYFDTYKMIEPRNYRVRIFDAGDDLMRNRSFYVSRDHEGERRYVRLPEATNSFAVSSSTCYHGSTFHKGHYKTTIAIHAELDAKRHRELLSRSISKFRDYCIDYAPEPASGPAAVLPYKGPD